MPAVVNYRTLLADAAARLETASDTPRLDAEILLAHALERPRSHLGAWPERTPDADQYARFEQLLARRLHGEPVAHILGQREFWSLELRVTPDTLIPRPDTEVLVETALEKIPRDARCRVLDLGTGTGAVALAMKKERPLAEICATDASAAALEIARNNAARLKLEVEFRQGDWWAPFADRCFEVVAGNPPYIPDADPHLQTGDLRFEPRSALAAGPDGLDAIRRIVADVHAVLAPGGWLLLEHGRDQAPAVAALLARAGFTGIGCRNDLAKRPRVSFGQWPARPVSL